VTQAPFEVHGFCAAPASDDVALVELRGRFTDAPPPRAPLLLVEDDERRCELAPATSAADDGAWRATWAVPLQLADRAAYALVLPGLVLDLPAPDPTGDRVAAMARELNQQRRRVEAAEERAEARVGAAEAEANAARGALGQVELRAAERTRDAEERAARLQAELEGTSAELAQERQASEAATSALRAALEVSRDQTTELRRTLKQMRAELEAARREHEAAREDLEALRREQASARARHREAAADAVTAVAARRRAEDPDDPADFEELDDLEVDHSDDLPSRAGPARAHPAPLPAGERVERVRVLGRERRAPAPDAPPTPIDAPPLDPQPAGTLVRLAVLALLIGAALVVLVLLLLG
jgi:hypothetical protein